MAFTVGEREVRPLTADEVLRMVELEILSEDEPVELLEGALVEMSPKGVPHEVPKIVLNEWLAVHAASGGYRVGIAVPVVVPDRTGLPEPDLSALPRDVRFDYANTPLLVIEVAVSSWRTDTRVKSALYAAARIPEYWIVEPKGRRVHVLDEPEGDRFARVRVLREDELLVPRYIDVPPLPVAALFAEL